MAGLRRGELFGLRWSDIDLGKGRLTVNQSLEQVKRKAGRSGKSAMLKSWAW
jgi:integrase